MERRRADVGGGPGQLVGGTTGAADVGGGEQDLDVGGQHLVHETRVDGLLHGAADRRRGRRQLSFGQPEQRHPRLGLTAPLARPGVHVLGPRQFAAQPQQLRLAVERVAECRMAGRPGELLEGSIGLLHGAGPLAVDLQDLGPMDETLAAIRHEVGL